MGNSCKITFEKKMMSLGIILCMQGNVWRLHTLGRIWVYFNYNVDMYKYSIYKYQWTSKDQKLCCCWNADWHCNGAMSGPKPRQCVGRGARANLGAAENGYPQNCKIHRNTDDETLDFWGYPWNVGSYSPTDPSEPAHDTSDHRSRGEHHLFGQKTRRITTRWSRTGLSILSVAILPPKRRTLW